MTSNKQFDAAHPKDDAVPLSVTAEQELHEIVHALKFSPDDTILLCIPCDERRASVCASLQFASQVNVEICRELPDVEIRLRASTNAILILDLDRIEAERLAELPHLFVDPLVASTPIVALADTVSPNIQRHAIELGITFFVKEITDQRELLCQIHNSLAIKRANVLACDYAEELEAKLSSSAEAWRKQTESLKNTNAALREACAAAETAARVKEQFLANVSHEVRTPLTAILGYSEMLMLHPEIQDEQRGDAIESIVRTGRHLLEIINDILDYSKLEARKFEVTPEKCSPHEIVCDVIRAVAPNAEAKGINLSREWYGLIPEEIETDPTRLRQVLLNLLSNAIRYTDKGSVQLTAELIETVNGKQLLQFSVADTGVGIPSDSQQQLFEAFEQGDNSMRRRHGGTGLGLTICKFMTELLGGTIRVESAVGKGSTFRATIAIGSLDEVRLIPGKDLNKQSAPTQEVTRTSLPSLNCSILLAEDSIDNRRLLKFLLEKSHASVSVVDNGRQALSAAMDAWKSGTPFDVILMDIQMPIMDGYTATKRLRESGYPGPIIALTAHAMADEHARSLASGCDDIDTKPICRERLVNTILRNLTRTLQGAKQ